MTGRGDSCSRGETGVGMWPARALPAGRALPPAGTGAGPEPGLEVLRRRLVPCLGTSPLCLFLQLVILFDYLFQAAFFSRWLCLFSMPGLEPARLVLLPSTAVTRAQQVPRQQPRAEVSPKGLVGCLQWVEQCFEGTVGSGQEGGHACLALLLLSARSHTKALQHLHACPPTQPCGAVAAAPSREALDWKEAGLESVRVARKVMPSPCHQ